MALLGVLTGITLGCLFIGHIGLAVIGAILCAGFYTVLN